MVQAMKTLELLVEHQDRLWRDGYGYTWCWLRWSNGDWDWGMRDAECLPWQRPFYSPGRMTHRAPYTLIGERPNKVWFRVYVGFAVSQIVEVEAESLDEAMETALGEVDAPNSGNRFEMDGDPYIVQVVDEAGDMVWDQSIPDPTVPG